MPLLLIASLIIACLPIDWPEPPAGFGVRGSAAMTGSVVAGLLLVAGVFSRLTIYQLARDPDHREAIARAHGMRRLLFVFLNLGAFWYVLLRAGWGWAARELLTVHQFTSDGETVVDHGNLLPAAEFLVIAPYLIVMLGSWTLFFNAERALHRAGPERAGRREFWSRWGYVSYLFRQQMLIVFLQVFLVITLLNLQRLSPDLLADPWAKAGMFVGPVVFILFVPLMLPLLFGLKPMEPGALRDRLDTAAKRLGVRYRNLYVWDTRGNIATAMVAGLVPRLRNIVFTDLLLATLKEEEVEAVFGHEVGHVRHGHILYYLAFLLLSILALGATYRAVELSVGLPWTHADVTLVFSVLLTFGYLFLVFGFVSRRCERQADVFGCKAVSCPDPACGGHIRDTRLVPGGLALCPTGVGIFVKALERVEEINGSGRESAESSRRGPLGRATGLLRFVGVWLGTWQHGTIAKRVEFLKNLDAASERRFQRRVTLMRWGLILLLVSGVVGVVFWRGWQPIWEGM